MYRLTACLKFEAGVAGLACVFHLRSRCVLGGDVGTGVVCLGKTLTFTLCAWTRC